MLLKPIQVASLSTHSIYIMVARKEKFTLFSDHNGSPLRRQPETVLARGVGKYM